MTLRRDTGEDGGVRASDRAAARAARRGGGFTLVELLVAIAIIGVLLGLVASGLTSARRSARGAVCLSNLHQIGVAWIEYMGDHDEVFPFDRPNDNRAQHIMDWGGVDWYDEHIPQLVRPQFQAERPINPYLGAGEARIAQDSPIFRCPSDNGLFYGGVTPFYGHGDEREVLLSNADDPRASIYATRGVSYFANEWIWIKPGSRMGWAAPAYVPSLGSTVFGFVKDHPATALRNRSTDVRTPSRFVVAGDMDWLQTGRIARERRVGAVINGGYTGWAYGAWHGVEACNAVRLDGSAVYLKIEPAVAANGDYDFWLDPSLHGAGSTVVGFTNQPAVGWPQ